MRLARSQCVWRRRISQWFPVKSVTCFFSLEILHREVYNSVFEVLASQMRVTSPRLHLKDSE